ncbi:uncharacterized protein TNCV_3741091 [Trichonephila clavipes]|nr:uncharacterized protein TNCV_3741091 [Trichonephila clavipes]
MSVATPMLVAMGKPEAKLTATVFKESEEIMTVPGNVEKLILDKFIPEESYELLVQDQDSDWEHRIPFEAVSACASSDVGVGDICLRLVKTEQGFASAKSKCASTAISEAVTDSISLIVPELDKDVQKAIQKLESNSDFWLDYSTQEVWFLPESVARVFLEITAASRRFKETLDVFLGYSRPSSFHTMPKLIWYGSWGCNLDQLLSNHGPHVFYRRKIRRASQPGKQFDLGIDEEPLVNACHVWLRIILLK